jgi:hypothetical protein
MQDVQKIDVRTFIDSCFYTQDFTNLKMPDGNVEPLISPKLAVAMESVSHFNSAIFFFLLQATLLDGAW